MFSRLPSELVDSIVDFLAFSDIGCLKCVCKNSIPFEIQYQTYERETTVICRNGRERVIKSYLLTNGNRELPSQITHNYVEIKLRRGNVLYYFTLYKNIYNSQKDILSYLQQYDRKIINWVNSKVLGHL